jgi:hypothetical protein
MIKKFNTYFVLFEAFSVKNYIYYISLLKIFYLQKIVFNYIFCRCINNIMANHLDTEFISNKELFESIKEMVSCIICSGVVVQPSQCNKCENTFCKQCIIEWMKNSNSCPFKCESFETKEASRTVKNLLEKLLFKCQYNCDTLKEFSYEAIIKHLKNCDNLKVDCPSCGFKVAKTSIKENHELNSLRERCKLLEIEKQELEIKNQKLQDQIQTFKDGYKKVGKNSLNLLKEKSEESELGLIDKCDHFKGNYKPIFLCCEKAYPCYMCHNEKESHTYEFSNKVVCLICNNIYTGSQCSNCNSLQVYRKK